MLADSQKREVLPRWRQGGNTARSAVSTLAHRTPAAAMMSGSKSGANHHSSTIHRKDGDEHRGTAGGPPRLFSGISPADYAGILAGARAKEFTRGEMLYMEGATVQQVMLLTSGFVKVTQLGPNGSEVILRLGTPGDLLDAASVLSTGRHGSTAQSLRLCRALVWDSAAFKALVQPFPVLFQNTVRMLGEHLTELEQRFREVATEKVGSRVARQLGRLLEKAGRSVHDGIELGLSREELAQMTGTTLFTVSRLFSVWAELGMVSLRREAVTICDVQALRAISDES